MASFQPIQASVILCFKLRSLSDWLYVKTCRPDVNAKKTKQKIKKLRLRIKYESITNVAAKAKSWQKRESWSTPSAFTDAVHDNEGSCRSTGQLTEVTVTSPPVISVNRPNTTSTPDPTDSLHPPDRSPRPQRHILIWFSTSAIQNIYLNNSCIIFSISPAVLISFVLSCKKTIL